MNHQELRDHYELFALGVADEPERAEIREHLSRGCEVCMAEVKWAREFTALLGASTTAAAPSARLRRRIMASTGYEEKRFGWAPFLAAALALSLFAAFYFSGRERDFATLAKRQQEEMRNQTVELTRLNEAFAILNGPETTVTSFGQGLKGKVFVNPREGVLLIASNLPQAPAGKAYEMWVISKAGVAAPAGMFRPDANGAAMHTRRGPVDVAATGAVAVTLENEAGVQQPTAQPLIVAPVQ